MNWIKYWRNTLADADRKIIDVVTDPVIVDDYYITKVPYKHNSFLWYKEKKETEFINIVISPCKYVHNFEHGKKHKSEEQDLFPYWVPAKINRQGEISTTLERPFFVRDYLTPNPKNYYSISSIIEVDENLKKFDFKINDWHKYWTICEQFFETITGKKYNEYNQSKNIELYIQVSDARNMSANILCLYDNIINDNYESAIIDKIATSLPCLSVPLPNNEIVCNNKNHVGQMNGQFPLAKSQREAVYAFTQMEQYDVLAVNGPPGTGKTTFLQSVVANLVVQSVIENKPPFLIVASSTNNQAITNILESFELKSDSIISERWIPGIKSFGLYLSSKKDTGYQSMLSEWGEGFFKEFEADFDVQKTIFYEKKFNDFFCIKLTIEECIKYLKNKILLLKNELTDNLLITYQFQEINNKLNNYGLTDEDALYSTIKKLNNEFNRLQTDEDIALRCETQLIKANQQISFFDRLLSFLPSVKARRALSYKRATVEIGFVKTPCWHNFVSIRQCIDETLIYITENKTSKIKEKDFFEKIAFEIEQVKSEYKKIISKWDNINSDKLTRLYNSTGSEYCNLSPIEDMNIRMDITCRFEMFWLAVHQREAEYLQLLSERKQIQTKAERGKKGYRSMLERYAYLTPLFISTFHSLPKYATYYDFVKKDQPFYNLFDYLIVDESGQVSPDVALASFSLTQKVVAVGDVNQIEPVWSATEPIDIVNLQNNNLIDIEYLETDYLELKNTGNTCSSGNLMKIAQRTCKIADDSNRGILLKEHRRCLDSIISYSNEYVYGNRLIPKKGNNHSQKHNLPPKGYMFIPGASQIAGTSKNNIIEAKTIALWINQQCDALENDYNKKIHNIIAVVTPYKAQASLIMNELRQLSKRLNEITVGTVHSLQGAERDIVILSTVLTKFDNLTFLNNQYNMLNVATSRAKHSFLVFGNTSILNAAENNPLGNLKKWLLTEESSELSNNIVYESLDIYKGKISRINKLDEHRRILIHALHKAKKELIIVSPFITNIAIETEGIIPIIKQRVSDGIVIKIITDSALDMINGKLKPATLLGRQMLTDAGAKLLVINGIHSKTLVVDDSIIVEGSFNWLSAVRDSSSKYSRHETSIIIQNEDAFEKIIEFKKELTLLVNVN